MSNRKTYYEDENLVLEWEMIDGMLFVHTHFTLFNRDVLKKLKEAWAYFLIDAYFDGFEEVFTYTKDPRIVEMIGGAKEIDDEFLHKHGLRMYKWELD